MTMETSMEGAVYVQTNAAHNEVIAFARGADGMLEHAGTFSTGEPATTWHTCHRRGRSRWLGIAATCS